jgi:ubiquinone/menaquinone biosynthesis C-methylase UbiE
MYSDIVPAGGDTATPLNLTKRLSFFQRHGALEGARVLDCGCGAGEYVAALRRAGSEAYGVEFLAEKIAEAYRHGIPPDWVKEGNLEHLEFADESFDLAILNEVLEHVPNESRALTEVRRVLRPGGRLLVLSPNRLYPFETHGVRLRGSTHHVPHYVPFIPYIPLRLGRVLFDYWARNYWPRQLADLVVDAGFELAGTDYLWQTFENISGNQPRLIAVLRPFLRTAARIAERVPGLRRFGVSQAIIATKPTSVRDAS